jgi:hypothetical protein
MGAAEDVSFALGFLSVDSGRRPLRTLGIPNNLPKVVVAVDWD